MMLVLDMRHRGAEIRRGADRRDGARVRGRSDIVGRTGVLPVVVQGMAIAREREHATPLELCTHGLSLGRTRLFHM